MNSAKPVFLLLFLFSSLLASAQQFNFKNYSVKDGVAQSQVYSVLQDSRGYLWLGTRGGGITRFDGVKFKTFTQKEGLSNNYVFCIREDARKNLWIGTNVGFSHYNGVKFTNYQIGGDTLPLQVLDIAFDKKGRKWLATSQGVLLLDDDSLRNITLLTGKKMNLINTIITDSNGVWYGNSMGVFRIEEKDGKFEEVRIPRIQKTGVPVHALKFDRAGNLWIGTYGDGIYLYRSGAYSRIAKNPELDEQSVFDIFFDNNNNVWIATLNKGVCQYNLLARSFAWLGENEGLSNNHVRSIIQDKSNTYWFGTSGGGVCSYSGKQFTTYDKSSGLGGNFINSVYIDKRQRLFAGTSDKGFTILDSGRFINYNASTGFYDVKVKAICGDNYGNVYLGTESDGLYLFRDSSISEIEAFSKKYIRAMIKDKDGNIYVATSGHGLYKIIPSAGDRKIVKIGTTTTLLSDRIACLHYDKKGQLWYGTDNHGIGVIINDQVSILKFNTKNGLPSNSIRCFTEDKRGYLWAGTAGNGIFSIPLYQGDYRIRSYSYKDGLNSSNIYLLTTDDFDRLFAGSETGLDCILRDSTGKFLQVKHYSKGEGFTGIETSQNAVFNDSNSTIWFGTINGLIKYVPADKTRNENAPVTTINDVRLFYQSLLLTSFNRFAGDWNVITNMILPYDQNHLSFDFQGINFSNPEAVSYQWKLEGFDRDWSPASKQTTVTYSNIPPGNYVFMVRSCNEDGVWNKEPAVSHFSITPPFWMRLPVIFFFILFLGVLVYLVFRWRIDIIRKKDLQRQQQLQLEKEVVELEQKALRLQMNPHFIFNALNSIQSQIGTDNEQSARYYLAKFSRLMRQILDNSRNSVITLQEEINTLENYLLIEKFCNGDRFDYNITIDEHIEADYITTPPMLLQPFIENSIKHGMKFGNGKRGLIEITIKEKEGILECTVTDNGIGREKSAELNKNSKETYHVSTALLVTKERLDLLKMDKGIIPLEITDLYDENGNSSGTRVTVRIPV